MRKLIQRTARCMLPLAALVLALISSGCTLTLISQYDEITDKAVSDLQKKVDSFLITLERTSEVPACTHATNKEFYIGALASTSSLLVRNEGRPKNSLTVSQLRLLEDSIKTLENLHKIKGDGGCMTAEEIEPVRSNMNTSFTAIMKLEIAKKRSKKGNQE